MLALTKLDLFFFYIAAMKLTIPLEVQEGL